MASVKPKPGRTIGAVVVADEARRVAPGGEHNHIHIRAVHALYQALQQASMHIQVSALGG